MKNIDLDNFIVKIRNIADFNLYNKICNKLSISTIGDDYDENYGYTGVEDGQPFNAVNLDRTMNMVSLETLLELYNKKDSINISYDVTAKLKESHNTKTSPLILFADNKTININGDNLIININGKNTKLNIL